jgi:hypothetical protein
MPATSPLEASTSTRHGWPPARMRMSHTRRSWPSIRAAERTAERGTSPPPSFRRAAATAWSSPIRGDANGFSPRTASLPIARTAAAESSWTVSVPPRTGNPRQVCWNLTLVKPGPWSTVASPISSAAMPVSSACAARKLRARASTSLSATGSAVAAGSKGGSGAPVSTRKPHTARG